MEGRWQRGDREYIEALEEETESLHAIVPSFAEIDAWMNAPSNTADGGSR